jgi:hypothetical protein
MDADLEGIVGREPTAEIRKLSFSHKVAALRKLSEQMSSGPALSRLQRYIVALMTEEQGILDLAEPVIPPNAYDVVVTDITPEDLSRIGAILGCTPLAVTSATPSFPVQGILFGMSFRIFVPLIVKVRSRAIHVNFFVGSASPYTYLRPETLVALGYAKNVPEGAIVEVHGTAMTVYPSARHFENVDLLGQNYFSRIRAILTIDYPMLSVEVRTSN